MTKTMKINELVSKLKEYDGELTVKVWSNGADKDYPISHVGQGHTDGVLDTYVSIVVDDDRNLVDLSKIWHDASEEPKWSTVILCLTKKRNITMHTNINKLLYTLIRIDIDKWAYVKDLLPKGGEK